jgi:hypothetical protein
MREKKQKISYRKDSYRIRGKGKTAAGALREFRAAAVGLGDFRIYAASASEAEKIARRLIGSQTIYRTPETLGDVDEIVKAIADPEGSYEGEVLISEGESPAQRKRR